jgi:hypothetical protein
MNKEKITTFFLTILIGTLGLSFEVQGVEASGTIYIRADGSIDPPTAPITTANNVTYTLARAPYIVDANNIDNYPLMTQYIIPEFPSNLILPLFFIATLVVVIVHRRKHVKS